MTGANRVAKYMLDETPNDLKLESMANYDFLTLCIQRDTGILRHVYARINLKDPLPPPVRIYPPARGEQCHVPFDSSMPFNVEGITMDAHMEAHMGSFSL